VTSPSWYQFLTIAGALAISTAVENLCEGRSLPISRWQVLLQNEH
jgi:hypothetical protein